jgi:hypothetical protein
LTGAAAARVGPDPLEIRSARQSGAAKKPGSSIYKTFGNRLLRRQTNEIKLNTKAHDDNVLQGAPIRICAF